VSDSTRGSTGGGTGGEGDSEGEGKGGGSGGAGAGNGEGEAGAGRPGEAGKQWRREVGAAAGNACPGGKARQSSAICPEFRTVTKLNVRFEAPIGDANRCGRPPRRSSPKTNPPIWTPPSPCCAKQHGTASTWHYTRTGTWMVRRKLGAEDGRGSGGKSAERGQTWGTDGESLTACKL
jgi:hypothetical protein